MEVLYLDNKIIVCVKPAGVLSTDEPGGMPSLLRAALGDDTAPVYTVHRLDAAVSGVMVYARTRHAAADLGRAIERGDVRKEYLAVACGELPEQRGELRDLLRRDRKLRKTFLAEAPGKDVREARLAYEVLASRAGLSLCRIRLYTGRAHQIRVQHMNAGFPLWGDNRYGGGRPGEQIALWAYRLTVTHPTLKTPVTLIALPPDTGAWTAYRGVLEDMTHER